MRTGTLSRSVRRSAARMVAVVGLLSLVGVAAAQDGGGADATAFLDSLRSLAHIIGITASAFLVYYAVRARRKFVGGVFGDAAGYVIVGGGVFGVAFVVMELEHGFGVNLLAFVPGMQWKMALNMVLFTITVFAFGTAFYRTASVLRGE